MSHPPDRPMPSPIDPAFLRALTEIQASLKTSATYMAQMTRQGGSATAGPTTGARRRVQIDDDYSTGDKKLSSQAAALRKANALALQLTKLSNKELASGKGKKLQQEYDDAIERTTGYINEQSDAYDKLVGRTLPRMQEMLDANIKAGKGFKSALAGNQQRASLLSAAMLKTHWHIEHGTQKYDDYVNELAEATKGISKGFKKNAKMLDDTGNELRDNLSPKDFAKLRVGLGNAQSSLSEAFSGLKSLGFDSLDALVSHKGVNGGAGASAAIQDSIAGEVKGPNGKSIKSDLEAQDKITSAIEQASLQVLRLGERVGKVVPKFDEAGNLTADTIQKLKEADPTALAQSLNEFQKKLATQADALDKAAQTANSSTAQLKKDWLTKEGLFKKANLKLEEFASAAAAGSQAAKAWGAVKDIGAQIADFNIAQIPASFMDVQKASVKLGMSFEDTVKFMADNKSLLGIQGNEGFQKLTSTLTGTFKKYGYTSKQASEIIAPAAEGAQQVGVNMKSANDLNGFIDDSMKSFQKISGVINMSAKAYMDLNNELYTSSEVASTMNGMDSIHAQQYAKDLVSQRDELRLRGVSIQQAQALIKAQEAAKNEKLDTRITEGAKVQTQMQYLGFSADDSARANEIHLKGNSASAEESKWLQDKMVEVGTAAETAKQNAYATGGTAQRMGVENAINNVSPGGSLAQMQVSGEAIALANAKKSNAAVGDAGKIAKDAKGSEAVADVGNIINSVSSLLNNKFTVAILAATGALASLALSSAMSSATMGKGGLIGKMGDLLSNVGGGKGILGKLGGGISAAADVLGGGTAKAGGQAVFGAGGKLAGALGAATAGGVMPTLSRAGSAIADGAGAAYQGIPKALSAGKGLLAGAGTALKAGGLVTGLAGAVGGMALDYGGDKLKENGHEKAGALMHIGSAALQGAAMGMVAGPIGAAIGGAIGTVIGTVSNWSDLTDGLGDAIGGTLGGIGDALSSSAGTIWTAAKGFGSTIAAGGSWILDKNIEAGKWLIDSSKSLGSSVWNGVSAVASSLLDGGQWMVDSYMSMGSTVWGGIKTAGGALLDGGQWLTSVAAGTGTFIRDSFTSIFSSLADSLKWVFDTLKSILPSWLTGSATPATVTQTTPVQSTPSTPVQSTPSTPVQSAQAQEIKNPINDQLTSLGFMAPAAARGSSPASAQEVIKAITAVSNQAALSPSADVNKKQNTDFDTANKATEDSTLLAVEDVGAKTHLVEIATSMAMAVKILQQILDEKSDQTFPQFQPIASNSRSIPSASSYMTGRV